LTALKKHRNQTVRMEHATRASCRSSISDPAPSPSASSPSSAAGPGDRWGPSLPARAGIPALPCLLGWCQQEKTTHFWLTPARAILYARVCVYTTRFPLFSSGVEGCLGWKGLAWAVFAVEGASTAGMLWLPGSAPSNRWVCSSISLPAERIDGSGSKFI